MFGKAKETNLTSAEVSALWLQYMGDTMAVCVYKYFLNIVESKPIKSILELALQLAENHIKSITSYLGDENFHIPKGFTEEDVNLNAPRLFTDEFTLFYTYIMTIHGITAYSLAITNSERKEIQDYFMECTASSKELFQKTVMLVKDKPYFSTVPSVPSPKEDEFFKKTGILDNLVGDKRPLNSSEIGSLFFNSRKTGFIRTLSLGFSQVAQSEEVRSFMLKNVKLAGKDADRFDQLLQQDHLPIPEKWDGEITDSTVSPFSDKLMMFHAAFLVNAALSYYGAGLGTSLRSDLVLHYRQVFTHAMEAGAFIYHIMVKHEWLEKIPETIDHEKLAKRPEK